MFYNIDAANLVMFEVHVVFQRFLISSPYIKDSRLVVLLNWEV